ncbi:SecDF P1 head subdomain-containing protein [Pseudomonas fluorescens]|uniref:SecDF P1 head subdomain-containing protein n=1 Tax=Pseudomonas fluorescens TaxID=294 RepID=UPI003F983078
MRCKVLMVLLAMVVCTTSQAAEIGFSSTSDFTKMEILLKDIDTSGTEIVVLNVTLSAQAAERVRKVSTESIGQPLTLSINGRVISRATVHSALGAKFQIAMSRATARELVPSLLE